MKKIWSRYKETVQKNCTDQELDETQIAYWRNSLFSVTVIYLIPLSVIAIVPGVYMSITTNLPILLAADFLVVSTFLVIAFNGHISVNTKKLMLTASLYVVTVVLLYYLGSFGPGLLYLLSITIFATLIFDIRYAISSVVINLIICIVFALIIYFDWGTGPMNVQYGLNSWIAVSSNVIFMCVVTVLLIPKLFNGLQKAFDNKNRIEKELKLNQAELNKSLDQLEEKNRELVDFAYTISHDLKEPLRMIRSFMGRLKMKYEEQLDEQALKYIHFAMDGAQRMNSLIDDLLEYSRVGRLHFKKEMINLNDLIDEIKQDFNVETGNKKPVITAENLPEIKAVPISIKLLFQNLISNGIKYQNGSRTPEVSISCEATERHWIFKVKDNGIGIPSEYYDQIFNIFKRLHSISEFSGTGMGLAICKKVVTQHGGEIWVESEEGLGSSFYFSLQKN
tara:strand:+ start:23759 stop:25108 length:1350 start_codon:yes stop_codon:yes gene_type:complete